MRVEKGTLKIVDVKSPLLAAASGKSCEKFFDRILNDNPSVSRNPTVQNLCVLPPVLDPRRSVFEFAFILLSDEKAFYDFLIILLHPFTVAFSRSFITKD